MDSKKGRAKDLISLLHSRPLECMLGSLALVLIYALLYEILTIVYIIFTFGIIVLIDYRDYLEIPGRRQPMTMTVGAALVALGLFMSIALNRFTDLDTDERLGSTDFIPLLLGLMIFFYGFGALRVFFVPLGISLSFLAITIIPATSWGEHIHEPFVQFTVESSMRLVDLTDYTAYNNGADVTLIKEGTRDTVTVDRGCSGFESTTYFGIFGSFLLWKLEGDRWKKVFIIVLGIGGLLLMNIFRVTLLILIYFWYDMSMLETFHSNLGNVLFFIWVGFMWWLSFTYLLPPQGERAGTSDVGDMSPRGDAGAPAGATSGTGVIASTVTGYGIVGGTCGESACVGSTESMESTRPVEDGESVEPIEPGEPARPTEDGESVEPIEPGEPARPTEDTGSAEAIQSAGADGSSESNEPEKSAG